MSNYKDFLSKLPEAPNASKYALTLMINYFEYKIDTDGMKITGPPYRDDSLYENIEAFCEHWLKDAETLRLEYFEPDGNENYYYEVDFIFNKTSENPTGYKAKMSLYPWDFCRVGDVDKEE